MTPYSWGPSNYLCPECDTRLESKGGPDHIGVQRCPTCDWSKVYDRGADEFPSRELERVTPVTDGGNSATSISRRSRIVDCRSCGATVVGHVDGQPCPGCGGVVVG